MDTSMNMSIDQVLAQMRQIRRNAGLDKAPDLLPPSPTQNEKPGFGNLLKTALDDVNKMQKTTDALQTEYIRSDGATDITRVMVASQKSSVAFQATVQVRNKLVEAYKEIMSMPV